LAYFGRNISTFGKLNGSRIHAITPGIQRRALVGDDVTSSDVSEVVFDDVISIASAAEAAVTSTQVITHVRRVGWQ